MSKIDLSKIVLPKKIPKLTAEQLCQGRNTLGDSKDLLTWIDEVFKHRETRIYVERQMGLELGILPHSLLRWSDSVSKKEVADFWNKMMDKLEKSYENRIS